MIASTLGWSGLAFAALLVLIGTALTLSIDVGIARTLVVAAVRTIVQLLLVGLILKSVFAAHSPALVGAVLVVMFATATFEVMSRQEQRLRGIWRYGIGTGTMLLATSLAASIGIASLRPDPWFEPQTVVPMVGIVLGSVMNGVSISLNLFNTTLVRDRVAIEARLALGATRELALQASRRSALRSGLIPVVNQMSAAGIITLPGLMTGQILAGMSPFEAAKYQVFILFLLAGGTALGCYAAIEMAARRMMDERDRLRLDRFDSK